MANWTSTRSGHNMYDMASMLQKAIRRSNVRLAGYAAYELFGNFHTFLWRRLIVISAEDVFGIMTQEIIALKYADDEVNGKKKGYDRDPLFVAKAITLLCMARKNRDAVYVACNFMRASRPMNPDDIPHADISQFTLPSDGIPDWVFDVHTYKGKMLGKTEIDMGEDEQMALTPHQISFFDYGDWSAHDSTRFMSEKERAQAKEIFKSRVLDPTDIEHWHKRTKELNARIEELENELDMLKHC